jgi:hypothetical protein
MSFNTSTRTFAFVMAVVAIVAGLLFPTPQIAAAQDPTSVPDQPSVIEVPGLPVTFFTNGHPIDRHKVAEMCQPTCADQELAQYVTPEGQVHLDGMFVVGLDRLMGFKIPAGYSARLFSWGEPIDVDVANVEQVFEPGFRQAIIFNGKLPEFLRSETVLRSSGLIVCDDEDRCNAQQVFAGVALANSLDHDDYSLRESPDCGTYKLDDGQVIQFVNAAGEPVITGGQLTIAGRCGLVWISSPITSSTG